MLTQLTFAYPQDLLKRLSSMTNELNLTASWADFPKKKNTDVSLIATHPIDALTLEQHFTCFGLPKPSGPIYVEILPKKDWLKENRQQFPPLSIGRFFIYSAHADIVPPTDTINLEIEASVVFGSGKHETTQGCLLGLDWLAKKRAFHNALDMGCGSGILAIAIARLWSIPVLACDFDPASIVTTAENAITNNTPTVEARLSNGYQQVDKKLDLIMENILSKQLIDMSLDLSRYLNPGGYAVLSGMLEAQFYPVLQTHKKHGLICRHRFDINNWTTLILEKPL